MPFLGMHVTTSAASAFWVQADAPCGSEWNGRTGGGGKEREGGTRQGRGSNKRVCMQKENRETQMGTAPQAAPAHFSPASLTGWAGLVVLRRRERKGRCAGMKRSECLYSIYICCFQHPHQSLPTRLALSCGALQGARQACGTITLATPRVFGGSPRPSAAQPVLKGVRVRVRVSSERPSPRRLSHRVGCNTRGCPRPMHATLTTTIGVIYARRSPSLAAARRRPPSVLGACVRPLAE